MFAAHPSCLELPQEIVPVIKSYSWQCIECKKCAKCMDPGNEASTCQTCFIRLLLFSLLRSDVLINNMLTVGYLSIMQEQMMFCDRCDRGYHTFCVGVKTIPTGRWDCPTCQSRPFDLPQLPSAKKYVAT